MDCSSVRISTMASPHLRRTITGAGLLGIPAVHLIQDVLGLRQTHLAKGHETLVGGDFTEVTRLWVEEVHAAIVELRQRARETVELREKDFAWSVGCCYSSHQTS